MKKIAIIGAGISGLSLANLLKNSGFQIDIFEKARGVGGRMSTRRNEEFTFDHGAQCFTIRTKEFEEFLQPHIQQGIVTEWAGNAVTIENGKIVEPRIWRERHFVASPNMNSLCKKLTEGLSVKLETEIAPIKKEGDKWHLHSKQESDLGLYDIVISTAPPKQSVNLFRDNFTHVNVLEEMEMHACFSLMIGFKQRLDIPYEAAKIRNADIKWLSVNNSKPGRNKENTCIVVHASDTWSNKNAEMDIAQVQKYLVNVFENQTGIKTSDAGFISTHRWLYSIVKKTSNPEYLYDGTNNLAVCGDFCLTSRIEEAFISADKLAEKLKESL